LWLIGIYAAVFVLHVALPGRLVTGYARDGVGRGAAANETVGRGAAANETVGRRLRYRLNGLLVFFVIGAAYALLAASGVVPWDVFYTHRLSMLATAFASGLVFTAAVVLPAPADTGRSLLADLFLGRLENPQWLGGRVDAKMLLYLIGAVMLELLLVSFTAHHVLTHAADPSPGVLLYSALFTFFLVEYLFFEAVHLYTYDFVAERVGFKLGWGCLVFYPFFYCVGLWYAADRANPHSSGPWLGACAAVFFAGWSLARGANLQKYRFKTQPDRDRFGPFEQRAISEGELRVLVSGFWGLSRHINYLGELLMATGLTLSLGAPGAVIPWLYPLYYIVLLVPRQLDDDRRCAQKYGTLWAQYRRAVPYRIVPWIY
jgi:delta14-sterol reductase